MVNERLQRGPPLQCQTLSFCICCAVRQETGQTFSSSSDTRHSLGLKLHGNHRGFFWSERFSSCICEVTLCARSSCETQDFPIMFILIFVYDTVGLNLIKMETQQQILKSREHVVIDRSLALPGTGSSERLASCTSCVGLQRRRRLLLSGAIMWSCIEQSAAPCPVV